MKLNISKIPETKFRLIPVASQLLVKTKAPEVNEIESEGVVYTISDYFRYNKNEFIPKGVFRVATGLDEVDFNLIWKKYPESNAIYLFVGKEI